MAAEVGLKAQKLLAQGMELQPEEVNVRLGRGSGKKAQKMKGTTAIPVSGCIAWWNASAKREKRMNPSGLPSSDGVDGADGSSDWG